MCLSLQRRAIFPHRNFKKWSESVSFLTFWLANVPLATAACNFSTSQLRKVVRDRQFFTILKMCFSPQRRAIFPHRNFKKWSETVSFLRFWLENVLLATAACNFSTSQLQKVARTCSERRIFLENVLLATAACNFSTSQLQKVARACSERRIFFENVLLATAACHFSCLLSTATSAPAALARLLYAQNIEKHSISRLL